jgi:hypothetical protein
MKRFLAASTAVVLSGAVALGANLPFQTIWDPSNALGGINSLVQSINNGVTGLVGNLTTAYVSSGTALQTALAITLPNGLAVGQTYQMHAAGVNSADASVKTVTFAYGAATCAVIVTGSSNTWTADASFVATAAATQSSECHGVTATTNVLSVQSTGTVNNAASVATLIEVTPATSGTLTVNQAWGNVLR